MRVFYRTYLHIAARREQQDNGERQSIPIQNRDFGQTNQASWDDHYSETPDDLDMSVRENGIRDSYHMVHAMNLKILVAEKKKLSPRASLSKSGF
jgi:hypothetical protein